MKYLLILSFLFASCGIVAQSSFFNHMQDAARYDPFDILIKSDGNILFCTAAKQSENGMKTNYIYELDQWGQMLNSWTLHNDSIYWIENRRMIEDEGKIFVFGRGFETGPNWDKAFITMYVFDRNLNLLEDYELNLAGYAYDDIWPSRVKQMDSVFVIVGDISGEIYQPFYLKVNKEGQALEWAVDMNQTSSYTLVDDFLDLNNDNHLSFICFYLPNLSSKIIKYDNKMNQLSNVSLPHTFWFPFTALQETDSTFYVCGNELYEPNPDIRNFGVLKMHSDGTVLDEYIYVELQDSCSHVAHFNCLDRLPDGNLIVCTSYNLTGTFIAQQEPSYIRLYKFTPELDIIWQRYIGGDAMYEAYSMHAAPDGGVVVLGCYSPTPPPNMWQKDLIIFKTDANGLITGIGDENRQIRSSEAILFPNPAHDLITVDFSRVYQEATFQLIDISGKTVLETRLNNNRQQVDISGLTAGTYVYRIFNGEGLDERGKVVVE